MNVRDFRASFGTAMAVVKPALGEAVNNKTVERIWSGDHTLWKPDPTEITNRLGWLTTADDLRGQLGPINELARNLRAAGFRQALLLGMGGSSLAPEVFRKTFGVGNGALDLAVLDSTDPGAVQTAADKLGLARTLFIVSTKSGSTVETFSFFKFFYNRVAAKLGREQAGEHFIAITDPGSGLVDTANRYHFRQTFLANPNIGGRYSALSHFGIVPAVLVGLDVPKLLERAVQEADECRPDVDADDNPGLVLGVALGELAKQGKDKATFVVSEGIASFGDWVEQLIAESTGKEGTGIVPITGEPLQNPAAYGNDRVFIHLRLGDDTSADAALAALESAGHPVLRFALADRYDLGRMFFLWEFATAVAGARLGINPFDQPNVEAAKVLAREMVAAYEKQGELPWFTPTLKIGEMTAVADVQGDTLPKLLAAFFEQARPGDYLSLQAYVKPKPSTTTALNRIRTLVQQRFRLATTSGYGPRFLHSTGQLHKGDGGHGLFIQIVSHAKPDLPIPDVAGEDKSSITFGVLKLAQSLGDRQALLNAHRRIIRFDVGEDVDGALRQITTALPG